MANGWMQNPIAADFNFETMRMEMLSFSELVLNPLHRLNLVHTVAAGYCTGAIFVLSISAWYLMKGRDLCILQNALLRLQQTLVSPLCYPLSCWVMNPVMKWVTCRKPNSPRLKVNGILSLRLHHLT